MSVRDEDLELRKSNLRSNIVVGALSEAISLDGTKSDHQAGEAREG